MATIRTIEELEALYGTPGKPPRRVMVITVEQVFFQCARAIVRANLWNSDRHVDPKSLPTQGRILAETSENRAGGEAYDKE